MTASQVLATLENELQAFPPRADAEGLYRRMLESSEQFVATDRVELVEAVRSWLASRAEPKTMIGVSLAQELGLIELRRDLEDLRADINAGRAFLPYYVRWVDEALAKLSPAGP